MPKTSWRRRLPAPARAADTAPAALAAPALRASLARAVAAALVLTMAAPAWPQGLTVPAARLAPSSQQPAPTTELVPDASDQVYDNLNRSVRAGQKLSLIHI